jgi:hypothetical protein
MMDSVPGLDQSLYAFPACHILLSREEFNSTVGNEGEKRDADGFDLHQTTHECTAGQDLPVAHRRGCDRQMDGSERHDLQVHAFGARVGGTFRIAPTYHEPTGTGKSTAETDIYRGRS